MGDDEGKSYTFFAAQVNWSRVVSLFDTSSIYIIQPTWLLIFAAGRSFHSVGALDGKLQPKHLHHVVFSRWTKSLIQLKNCLCWNRQKQRNSHVPGSQAVKSEPSAVEIPVIPLTLTLMCFSLDRPVWNTGRVTWHYKCLFIKLSLQVISLGSCVLVHFFLCFPHFSEIQ